MKIGDKVNFLSETGGGVIAGFKGNNIALVEDEDGFQIPTPLSDLVLSSDSGDYSTSKVVASKSQQAAAEPDDAGFNKSVKAKINAFDADEEEPEDSDPADGDITFTPLVEERKGGNVLNVYLAFVPDDIKNLSKSKFNCYAVNDSNYYLRYAYLSVEGSACTLRSEGEIEPNTKVFIGPWRSVPHKRRVHPPWRREENRIEKFDWVILFGHSKTNFDSQHGRKEAK